MASGTQNNLLLDPMYSCSHCNGKSAAKRCSGCKTVFYCDVNCQKQDWLRHKHCCTMLQNFVKRNGLDDSGNEEREERDLAEIETAIQTYLGENECEKAEQLCVQVIRSQSSSKTPKSGKMFLLLAEIIWKKSKQSDLSLVERNNKILHAAALCNYVLNLCNLDLSSTNADFSETKNEVAVMFDNLQESIFLSIGVDVAKGRETLEKSNKYRVILEEIRSCLRSDLDMLPNANHDDLEKEFERYQKVQELYKRVGEGMRKLSFDMLEDCSNLLGSPPCDFAAIALGSLARFEATPYSDLEWAILIEKQDEECKVYFRNLTQLLHLIVLNFGETILPSMDIPCLRSWFYDDVTPRGMAFDGAMPQACKTPLGKRDDDGRVIYELIGTPKEISRFQRLEWVKVNDQLAGVMRTVLLLNKSGKAEKLVEEYKVYVEQELERLVAQEGQTETDGKQLREFLALLELNRDFHVFHPRLGQDDQAGKFYDVKREIYRLMDRFLASFALYFNASGQSAWDCLKWLHNKDILGEKAMQNLFVAVSIGAEMRARAYTEKGRQDDYLGCWTFIDASQKGLDNVVSMIGAGALSIQILFRYYYTMLPFLSHLWMCFTGVPGKGLSEIENNDCYCDSLRYRALVHIRFRQYNKAKVELQRYLMAHPQNFEAASDFGNVLTNLQRHSEAAVWHCKALLGLLCCDGNYLCNGEKLQSLDQITCWRDFMRPLMSSMNTTAFETVRFHCIRVYLYNLGFCFNKMKKYEKAIDCLECCVELHRDFLAREGNGTSLDFQVLAASLNLLGVVHGKCDDDKGLVCMEESLNLYEVSRSTLTTLAEATVKYNLGTLYYRKGEFNSAQTILQAALDQFSYGYGKSEGSKVLVTKLLLGKVYLCLQRYNEAVVVLTDCMELAARSFQFGTSTPQSEVESFFKIALIGEQISQGSSNVKEKHFIEILDSNHGKESVVIAILKLAQFIQSQKPKWAFNISKKCLDALNEIYGEKPSSNCTNNLRILGWSCFIMGKIDMAVDYLTRALKNHRVVRKMRGSITDKERSVEISLLDSLGHAYREQESYVSALESFQECLEIQGSMPHDKTSVLTLLNLGNTYCQIDKFGHGLVFLEMAFEGVQQILAEDENQTFVDRALVMSITEPLCIALRSCNKREKIEEVNKESSRLMDILSKRK